MSPLPQSPQPKQPPRRLGPERPPQRQSQQTQTEQLQIQLAQTQTEQLQIQLAQTQTQQQQIQSAQTQTLQQQTQSKQTQTQQLQTQWHQIQTQQFQTQWQQTTTQQSHAQIEQIHQQQLFQTQQWRSRFGPRRKIGPERPPEPPEPPPPLQFEQRQQPQQPRRRLGPDRPPQAHQRQQTQQTQTERQQIWTQQTQTERPQTFTHQTQTERAQTQSQQAQTQQLQTKTQQTQTKQEQTQSDNSDFYQSPKLENILSNGISGLCNSGINFEYNYLQYFEILNCEKYLQQTPWHHYLFKVKSLLISLFHDEVFNEHNQWRTIEFIFPSSAHPPTEHLPKVWTMQIDWYRGLVDRKRLRQQICAELLVALTKIAVLTGGFVLTAAFLGGLAIPVAVGVGIGSGSLMAAVQFALPRLMHLYRERGYKKQLLKQTTVVDTTLAQLTTTPSAKKWQGFFSEFYFIMGKTFDPNLIFKNAANRVYFEPFKSKFLNLRKFDFPVLNNHIVNSMKEEEFSKIDIFWNGSSSDPMRDFLYFNYGLYCHLEELRKKLLLTDPALRWAETLEESMYATRFYFLSRTFYMSSFFLNFVPAIDTFCQKMLASFDANQSKSALNLQSYAHNLMRRLQGPPTNQSFQESQEHTKQALVTAVMQGLKNNGINDEKTLKLLCTVFQKIFLNITFPTNTKLRQLIDQYPHIINPIIQKYGQKLFDFLEVTVGAAGKITSIFIYSFWVDFVWAFNADEAIDLLLIPANIALVQLLLDEKVKKSLEIFRDLVSNKRLYDQIHKVIKITIGAGRLAAWGVQLGLGYHFIPAIAGLAGVIPAAFSLALFGFPLITIVGAFAEWLKTKYFTAADMKLIESVNKIIKLDENEKLVFLKPKTCLSPMERKLIFIEFGHFIYDKMKSLESPFKKVLDLKVKIENFKRHDKIERHLFQSHAVHEFREIIKSFVDEYVAYLKQIYQIQTIVQYCKLYSEAIKFLYDEYKTVGGTTHCQIGQMALQLLALYNQYQSAFTPEEVNVVIQLNTLYNGISN